MIRVNLLRERKVKRAEKGEKTLVVGAGVLMLVCIALHFFVHAPLADEIRRKKAANANLKGSIKGLTEETKDFDNVSQQLKAVEEQGAAIKRLNDARAVPAWFLHELSQILTKDHGPTMTPEMTERVKSDRNRQWAPEWDPKRVWIEALEEKGGAFTMRGGAQADSDVTQLALRLQASAFLSEVTPEGGQTTQDQRTGLRYYRFTVTGKVAY